MRPWKEVRKRVLQMGPHWKKKKLENVKLYFYYFIFIWLRIKISGPPLRTLLLFSKLTRFDDDQCFNSKDKTRRRGQKDIYGQTMCPCGRGQCQVTVTRPLGHTPWPFFPNQNMVLELCRHFLLWLNSKTFSASMITSYFIKPVNFK